MAMTWMDNDKRQWSCRVSIEDAKRLKANGIDIANPESFEVLFKSALSQIELLAELHRPQWSERGLSYEQFAELLIECDGRLGEVQAAFIEAMTDFFRRLGEPWMAAVVEKANEAAGKQSRARVARARSPEIDRLIDAAMEKDDATWIEHLEKAREKISGSKSISAPGSSESIQDLGPSES